MNSQKKNLVILCLVLAFVLLLGGAYVLYGQLSEKFSPNQLAVPEKDEGQPDEEVEQSGTRETAQETGDTSPDTQESTAQNVAAPDFTVYDIEGNEVHLSDYSGKPIVLNFWASWCGPCQSEMPDFQEKFEQLGDEIQFLMINMTDGSRETVDTASAFIGEQEYTFPVFYDIDYNAVNTYGVYSLPMTILINSEGNIVAHAIGAIDGEALQIGIDMIIK